MARSPTRLFIVDASLPSLTGIQVLVVDNHQDTHDLIEQVLTHADASVVAASSARDALRAVDDVDIVEATEGRTRCPRSLEF